MVIFSEAYTKFESEFHIQRSESVETYASPDDRQRILAEGVEMELYLKKFTDYHILMIGRLTTDNIIFDYPLRLTSRFVEDATDKKPLSLIRSVALKYGLDLQVGNESSKFIHNQFIPVNTDNTSSVIEISNPSNHRFMGPFWFRIIKQDYQFIAQCSLVYCLDIDEYLKSLQLNNKKNISFDNQFYEFSATEFGITENMVIRILNTPDKVQGLNLQGFRFKLYSMKIGNDYLLVQSKIESGELIQIAFWIKSDMIPQGSELSSIEPFEMLRSLVSNFGLTITFGTQQGQFLSNLKQFIRIPENQSHKIINVSVPKNHKFFKSDGNVISTKQNGGFLIQAALMYYIDVPKYVAWLNK